MQVVGLTKHFGARTLFDGVAFTLAPGERMAVVGRNGAGKTTLLRCLSGQIAADGGDVSLPKGAVIALHDQRPPLGRDVSMGTYIAEGMAGLDRVERELRALEERMAGGDHGPEVMGAYDRAQREFERLGGYESQSWLDRVRRGLGIADEWMERPLASFSGGELTRASLARALVARPDVLLLDEPTNHLDLASVEWLETALAETRASIIIVSHDRWFLESVTTTVLDMDPEKPRVWPMGYSQFRRAKAEALARQAQLAEAQAQEIARLERFVQKWSAGTRARQAQSRQKALDRITRIEAPSREKSLAFGFPRSEQPTRIVMETDGLSIGPAGHPLVADASFHVERGWRVAVVGPNGAGKTTLIETLLGLRKPLAGRVSQGHRVQAGYFSQHAEELAPDRTLVETVLAGTTLNNTQARSLLGRFLFGADTVEKKVEMLSGGERRRLSLVQLIAQGGNVLVLDEPTNHLDIESREALEEAVGAYDGTVLFVSHDRALIDLIATHTLSVEDGTLVLRDGGYTDLLTHRARAEAQATAPVVAPTPKRAGSASRDAAPRKPAGNGGKGRRPNPRQVARLETAIAELEGELATVEAALADPATVGDHAALTELGERHRVLQEDIAGKMEEWERAAGGSS